MHVVSNLQRVIPISHFPFLTYNRSEIIWYLPVSRGYLGSSADNSGILVVSDDIEEVVSCPVVWIMRNFWGVIMSFPKMVVTWAGDLLLVAHKFILHWRSWSVCLFQILFLNLKTLPAFPAVTPGNHLGVPIKLCAKNVLQNYAFDFTYGIICGFLWMAKHLVQE